MITIAKQARRTRHTKVSIPEPYEELRSLHNSVLALKELVEILAGQRGQALDAAVTWQDLLDLNWIRYEDIPHNIGSHSIQPPG